MPEPDGQQLFDVHHFGGQLAAHCRRQRHFGLPIERLMQMFAIEVIESRPSRRRSRRFAAVAVLGVALATLLITQPTSHDTSEPSPAAEGYERAGSINGVTFWIILAGPDELRLRTTGRLGGICNNDGQYEAVLGPMPVCAQSEPKHGSVFVYLLPSNAVPKTLSLTDGEAVEATGSIALTHTLAGKKLVAYLLPPTNTIVGIAYGG